MEAKTPREILEKFYLANNLEVNGGLETKSVKIELSKKISFYFKKLSISTAHFKFGL